MADAFLVKRRGPKYLCTEVGMDSGRMSDSASAATPACGHLCQPVGTIQPAFIDLLKCTRMRHAAPVGCGLREVSKTDKATPISLVNRQVSSAKPHLTVFACDVVACRPNAQVISSVGFTPMGPIRFERTTSSLSDRLEKHHKGSGNHCLCSILASTDGFAARFPGRSAERSDSQHPVARPRSYHLPTDSNGLRRLAPPPRRFP